MYKRQDVDAFVALTQKYVDVPELTPTIVNEYIKKIEVFAPDKSDVYKRQPIQRGEKTAPSKRKWRESV